MNADTNNVLTSSRMSSLMRCPRSHYWQFEIGLRSEATSLALHIGSAWARAMEARWNKLPYEKALNAAIPDGCELDEYAVATVSGLLAAYYQHYGAIETFGKLHPEVQFKFPLTTDKNDPVFCFSTEGKLDGLGQLHDERTALLEAKTTSAKLDDGSDYWLRLRFNIQILQYILAARALGWDISEAIYDVTRKPAIRPKMIDDLDEQGKKIILNKDGLRVLKANGEPRQTASEKDGWVSKQHLETADEYYERLYFDAQSRPEFYFARREIPILEDQLDEFVHQRIALARMLLHFRESEKKVKKREDAWPRNVMESVSFVPMPSSVCRTYTSTLHARLLDFQ